MSGLVLKGRGLRDRLRMKPPSIKRPRKAWMPIDLKRGRPPEGAETVKTIRLVARDQKATVQRPDLQEIRLKRRRGGR